MRMGRRMRVPGIIAGAGLLLLGCGDRTDQPAPSSDTTAAPPSAGASTPAPTPAGSNRTIVFLGTSLTAGYGIDPESAYPARVQHIIDSLNLPYTVMNAGESGETSAGAKRRLDWVLRSRPVLLVIETGANDGLRGQDVDTLRANIQNIIDRTRASSPETKIVIAGMEALPNLGADYTRRFRAVYPELAKANNVPLIPFLLVNVGGVDSLNQQDGIHPNERGAEVVARTVWTVIGPLLAS